MAPPFFSVCFLFIKPSVLLSARYRKTRRYTNVVRCEVLSAEMSKTGHYTTPSSRPPQTAPQPPPPPQASTDSWGYVASGPVVVAPPCPEPPIPIPVSQQISSGVARSLVVVTVKSEREWVWVPRFEIQCLSSVVLWGACSLPCDCCRRTYCHCVGAQTVCRTLVLLLRPVSMWFSCVGWFCLN